MRKILIKNGYYYLPNHNLLINKQILSKCEEILEKVELIEEKPVIINKEFIKQKVSKVSQITFGINHDCNLKCLYCIYGGSYHFEKKMSKAYMSFKTAKAGLDKLYEEIRNRYDKELSMGFYGGETLLSFKVIKQIVTYSKEKFKNWKLNFNLTTNGTLFNISIIDFLIKNDFSILVSLDGPEKNHNSKRIFKNGHGSFRPIWNNLLKIRNRNEKYYHERLAFNIVHSYDQSLRDLYNFFNSEELVVKNRVSYNTVIGIGTNYFEKYTYDPADFKRDFKSILHDIRSKMIELDILNSKSTELTSIEKQFFNSFLDVDKLNKKPGNIFHGTCFMDSRIFLDNRGEFFICENAYKDDLCIGNVTTGFDYDKMKSIIDDFTKVKSKDCVSCDFQHLCTPCFVILGIDGSLSVNKEKCLELKENRIDDIKNMIYFNEERILNKTPNVPKIYRFHQFIKIEKGKKNVVISNFLTGKVYHISKEIITHFENHKYHEIKEFMDEAMKMDLIIEVEKNTWVPYFNFDMDSLKVFDRSIGKYSASLCIEEGVDLVSLKKQIIHLDIYKIIFYGTQNIDDIFPDHEIYYTTLDFQKCLNLSKIDEESFVKTDVEFLKSNMVCNNCYGHKISITRDNKIRPCVYSDIEIDDLKNLTKKDTMDKIKKYWEITKDSIKKCRDCELRYVCFDCREIAQRANKGDINATNPHCSYNPYTGQWEN